MKKIILAAMGLGMLTAFGCRRPASALYTSSNRDFQCRVPWAWEVLFDSEGEHFNDTTFIGPFEPDFYRGVPSLSVRWHSRYSTHRLRDGSLEMYADADDFIRQTLDSIYGPERVMIKEVQTIEAAGRPAKYFVVFSYGPADPQAQWGTVIRKSTGAKANPRQHAYVVVPMPSGFYVLVYPATELGFAKYEPQFNALVRSFTPLKDGPGGALLEKRRPLFPAGTGTGS